MEDKRYLSQFRNQFIGKITNSELKHKHCQNFHPESPTHHFKDQTLKAEQKIREIEANIKERHFPQYHTSGGDADRHLCDTSLNTRYGNESYRHRNSGNICSQNKFPTNYKTTAQSLPPSINTSRRYQTTPAVDECIGDHRFLYENDSNIGGRGNGSEDSAKSQISSRTVVSRKSSHDLRKMVASQCKLHEVIDETLKQMCKHEVDPRTEDNTCNLQEQPSNNCPLSLSQCKRCSDRIQPVHSQKDVTTEIDKSDFLECRNTDTLTISVDDVVNSKVINPMIRKLQRMYLNNLKEEMSLMEDLERLPHKVNEVYKATIFKQKD